ncbi:MAG TPA: nuclear transport factor 2 family protein [Vicinamibacterales bacterium]
MDRERLVQRYFDAWNAHDARAIVSTFSKNGTYADPTTPGPLSGEAIGQNAEQLWSSFPDVTFQIRSHGSMSDGRFAAEWTMKGTNTGSFAGLPPTGRGVVLPGADFIRVSENGIDLVQGYFDAGEVPRQLGLDIVVQPKSLGPFSFGTSVRVAGSSSRQPGAFSITALHVRSTSDTERVGDYSRRIAAEMIKLRGFLGWLGVVNGDRMLTISAWETAADPAQLMSGGLHSEAASAFLGPDLAAGGWTSVWVPDRINTLWARCASCGKMVSRDAQGATCQCGASLGPVPAYW